MPRRGLLLLILASVAMPTAAQAAKPDLVVSAGSVAAEGGRLTGSVSFTNRGGARARRSSAELTARVPGRPRRLAEITVLATAPSATRSADLSVPVPKSLPQGAFALRVCADVTDRVGERSERNNCRRVGTIRHGSGGGGGSSVPANPIDYRDNEPQELSSAQSSYWLNVPPSYDDKHRTPATLLVWMHGCGGDSGGDIYNVTPGDDRSYVAASLGGRDGECWNPGSDQAKVLAAVADIRSHLNIDPRRVVLGGYSSGGDLAYRTAFEHSRRFAGLIAENTSPFRDTGLSQEQALAAATAKFHVVHLAHTGDEAYPIAGVRQETGALRDAGFPIEVIERPGAHYDDDTDSDLRELLLPHLDDGWLAPAR